MRPRQGLAAHHSYTDTTDDSHSWSLYDTQMQVKRPLSEKITGSGEDVGRNVIRDSGPIEGGVSESDIRWIS